jgi:putative endonuclease
VTGADRPARDRWRAERRARDRLGRRAEWIAALALTLRGHRILALREKTPLGEIDLIAVRGRRVAFVEVKRRATRAEAEAAVTAEKRARIRRAAGLWLAAHPRYQAYETGFDLVLLAGRGWPVHIANGL